MIEPIKIDSSQGEPLYAEIPFNYAQSTTPIQVSIAQSQDLNTFGINANANPSSTYFNTYVRQNSQGKGVIVIISTRPIQDNSIDLVLKINDGNQTRLQQIRSVLPNRIDRLQSRLNDTTLQPRSISNEKDIALNLPVVKDRPIQTRSSNENDQALIVSQQTPPKLNIQRSANNTLTNTTAQNNNATTANQIAKPIVKTQATSAVQSIKNQSISAQKNLFTPQVHTKSEKDTSQHAVKANESLWGISAQIAQLNNVPIQHVMQQIKNNNPQAFIHGQANYLKQGAILTIPTQYQVVQPKTQTTQNPPNTATAKKAPTTVRLDQAHMSIVANTPEGSLQGSQKLSQAERHALQTLSNQIYTQRHITLQLQGQVRQLDQQLKVKNQRIQILNARLAELQKQLKAKKTLATSTPKS
ncbi:hypothetical protein BJI46_05125 [Acinetobacter qingfengensis]|uniref:FimV N-terminal domain-containing protein n=1 Tax=Acinetobacter qingfengensis TaxID=1262585 RepID=A0A1E7R1F5_9GAMM|nr:hypothetical protein BJI46_05125 [Acinetobacter qingfengensis]